MGMFDKLIANLKASKKTIVFTEGEDARILSAADRLLKEGLMGVILCGEASKVKAAAAEGGFNIDNAEIIDPASYPEFDSLVAQMFELRKGKMTEEECRAAHLHARSLQVACGGQARSLKCGPAAHQMRLVQLGFLA